MTTTRSTVAYCWPLIDEIVVAKALAQRTFVLADKAHSLTDEQLEAADGNEVIVLGTYLDDDTMKKLAARAYEIRIYVHGEDEVEGARKWTPNVATISSAAGELDESWQRRLIRRASGVDEDDESFFRGAIAFMQAREESLEQLVDRFISGRIDEEEDLIRDGRTISAAQRQQAIEHVNMQGRRIAINENIPDAVLVMGTPTCILPLLKAAADASPSGIGINMRYQKGDITRISFYAKDLSKYDLSCIHEHPFNGGGSGNIKGCTIKGLLAFPTEEEAKDSLNELVVSHKYR